MEIKLPETTDVDLVIGDKRYKLDLIKVNDKLYELQQDAPADESWEKEWMSEFRLYLRQEYDLQLSYGQASYLAGRIISEASELTKKLNQ